MALARPPRAGVLLVLRRLLIVVACLSAGAMALAALFAWHGDVLLRAALERGLQHYLVPAVAIDGAVDWRLAPRPMLVVHDLVLRDAAGKPLAAVGELAVVLSDDALATRRLALASIDITGLALTLRREAGGRWNAERWLRPLPAAPQAARAALPPIGRVTLTRAQVRVEDTLAATFEDAHLDLGPLAPGQSAQARLGALVVADAPVAARLGVAASARVHVDAGAPRVADAQVVVDGRAGDWLLERAELHVASVTPGLAGAVRVAGIAASVLAHDQAAIADAAVPSSDATPPAPGTLSRVRVDARLALGALAGDAAGWSGEPLHLAVHATRGTASVDARLQAGRAQLDDDDWSLAALALELSSSGALPAARVVLGGAAQGRLGGAGRSAAVDIARGELALPHPAGTSTPLAVSFAGAAHLDAVAAVAHGTVAGLFDDSRFDGRWRVDAQATPPASLSLTLDSLDLDRYLPAAAADESGAADLALWRDWPLRVELVAGELRVRGLVTRDARLQLLGGQ